MSAIMISNSINNLLPIDLYLFSYLLFFLFLASLLRQASLTRRHVSGSRDIPPANQTPAIIKMDADALVSLSAGHAADV